MMNKRELASAGVSRLDSAPVSGRSAALNSTAEVWSLLLYSNAKPWLHLRRTEKSFCCRWSQRRRGNGFMEVLDGAQRVLV